MCGIKIQAKVNCHFCSKLIRIGLELSLIFEIETILLKNYIQNWILVHLFVELELNSR
jgi:hypothetical protein